MSGLILVVDSDARGLLLISTALEKLQCAVITAQDNEDAAAKLVTQLPDVIVAQLGPGGQDGASLLRNVRSQPRTARIPVMLLSAQTSEDERLKAYRAGADDVVTKPFREEELALRVARLLRRQLDDADAAFGQPCLSGDLTQVAISSVLVILEMEKKTGLLSCTGPQGEVVEVLMREGRIVHARVRDQQDPVDADCVYYLLTWTAGLFSFALCQIEGLDRVNESTTGLLMEGARLLDESREAVAGLPELSPDAVELEEEAITEDWG